MLPWASHFHFMRFKLEHTPWALPIHRISLSRRLRAPPYVLPSGISQNTRISYPSLIAELSQSWCERRLSSLQLTSQLQQFGSWWGIISLVFWEMLEGKTRLNKCSWLGMGRRLPKGLSGLAHRVLAFPNTLPTANPVQISQESPWQPVAVEKRYVCKQLATLKGTTGKPRSLLPTLYLWTYALMGGNLRKFPCWLQISVTIR